MKEPQPGTCFAFPTPELAKYSSCPPRVIPESVTAPAGLLEGQGWGQERIHNPGSPGDGEGEPRGVGPPSPHLLSPASWAPLETERLSHADGGHSLPISAARLPSACRPPSPQPCSPPHPLSPPCTPPGQERAGSLETCPPEGEHGCFSLNLSLPESRFQNATEQPESPKFDTELHHPSRVIYLISLSHESVSCSVVSNSMRPHGARQAPLSMDFPSRNTGVGCQALLQGVFPTQGSNLISCTAGRLFTI